MLLALRLLMEAIGYSVKTFSKPKEAVSFLENNKNLEPQFDYILTDLRMPLMNGLEVLRMAKEFAPNTPRVLISGHATAEEVEAAKKIGIHGFLGKPFTVDQLKDLLV